MKFRIPKCLLPTAVCVVAVLPASGWAQQQRIESREGLVYSGQTPARINTAPVQSTEPQRQRVADGSSTYQSSGSYRDGSRQANTADSRTSYGERGGYPNYYGGRNAGGGYRGGTYGGRYGNFYAPYAGRQAFAGGYGGRYPGYGGWGLGRGGYAPAVIIVPVRYGGWARNYPYAAPAIIVPVYRGWAAPSYPYPSYPIRRR